MKKIAVILSGCGHMDGSEIREAIVTILALDKANADYHCYAPDMEQTKVINHLTRQSMNEKRNVLVESARIARGKISPLTELKAKNYDAVIMPGGYGAALNLSSLASDSENGKVIPDLKRALEDFLSQNKPIGAICIAPAVLALGIAKERKDLVVTIGDDNDGMIDKLGAKHAYCDSEDFIYDQANKVVTCSAYMRDDKFSKIAEGIEKLVGQVLEIA